MRRRSIPLGVSLLALFASSIPALAWVPNGIPVCTAPGRQGPLTGLPVTFNAITFTYPGLVVAWEDRRSSQSLESDLYVRPLDPASGPTTDGTPLCVAPGDQTELALAAGWWDACGLQGGCPMTVGTWKDGRSGGYDDVFADRAFVSWAAGGVPVCRMPSSQQTPAITMSANTSGSLDESVIVWEDQRSGSGDIYAQRLDVNGQRLWDTSGVAVCTAAFEQYLPQVVSLEDGAVLVAWHDHRAFPVLASLRLTRVERDGTPSPGWPAEGLEVATSGHVRGFVLLPGGYLVWGQSDPGDYLTRVRATRVLASGSFAPGWGSAGIAIGAPVGDMVLTDAIPAGDGGLLVAWFDITYGITMTPYYRLRVQHLDPDGMPLPGWGSDGVAVASAIPWMHGGRLAASAAGGVYVTWTAPDAADGALILQRFTSTGGVASGWPAGGAVVCAAAGEPGEPVLGRTESGVIVAWLDARDDPADVYAQLVTDWGVVGPAAVDEPMVRALRLAPPRPNPARGAVALALDLPHGGTVEADVVDVSGRRVRALVRASFPAGRHALTWDGRDERGTLAPAGVYLVRVTTPDGEARARLVRLR